MKKRKIKKVKEPSLLRQIITIHYEQARRRKALRILTRQEWSLDFLSLMLLKAGERFGQGLQFTIENNAGQKLTLTYNKDLREKAEAISADNNIFNRLDDAVAVEKYIREHSVR